MNNSCESPEEKIPGCTNFIWREALYLPRWNVCVIPSLEVAHRIKRLAPKAQLIRDILNVPMLITSWWRPPIYNKLIGGAESSWHMKGGAIDFRCPGMTGDEIRHLLQPKLEELDLRMEDLPGASWVHVDDKEPGNKRFFRP